MCRVAAPAQGGRTNRLDFTRSLPVALWFACQPHIDAKTGEPVETDGMVMAVAANSTGNEDEPVRIGQDFNGDIVPATISPLRGRTNSLWIGLYGLAN